MLTVVSAGYGGREQLACSLLECSSPPDQCDKRKEQLLQLQRSKVERGTAELETLKKVCT